MIETVNGYVCRDCSDVALAKRNIDPTHPKDGPNGADRNDAPSRGDAVTFGGNLAALTPNAVAPARETQADQRTSSSTASRVDLSV